MSDERLPAQLRRLRPQAPLLERDGCAGTRNEVDGEAWREAQGISVPGVSGMAFDEQDGAMSVIDEYKRGYGKGYNVGQRRIAEVQRKCEGRVEAAIARAERAEQAAGFGRCEDCRHWRRNPQCAWGYCTPPPSEYVNGSPLWFGDGPTVTTSEAFGCVMFEREQQGGD